MSAYLGIKSAVREIWMLLSAGMLHYVSNCVIHSVTISVIGGGGGGGGGAGGGMQSFFCRQFLRWAWVLSKNIAVGQIAPAVCWCFVASAPPQYWLKHNKCSSAGSFSDRQWILPATSKHSSFSTRCSFLSFELLSSISFWSFFSLFFFYLRVLIYMWWGCYGLFKRHKSTELAHSFLFRSCVYFCFMALSTVFQSFPTTLCFLTLFFPS